MRTARLPPIRVSGATTPPIDVSISGVGGRSHVWYLREEGRGEGKGTHVWYLEGGRRGTHVPLHHGNRMTPPPRASFAGGK